ncbi:phosphate acyltransferase PlsX [Actinoallomurus iriomotensis]|uniref:Phosphate acyltransferase n=1 Tax=Actinoallomurus iriomotensis TaxID=478107 RepID=A0A9W6RXK5_9ACTN|nr:phosphate acyltransferase PlsX [Actinoallomurus iriomotensis]GLY83925.1 phosphate acyltransferase [Actinoallomurus iriomotensis]
MTETAGILGGTDSERIVVDAMGGDHAPGEVVAGTIIAAREHGVRPILVGQAARIRQILAAHDALGEIPIVNAEDVVAMDEGALAGLRRPRSSVAVACRLIRRGYASALVSAGSTGGVVATSRLRLRGQPGVTRPAIAVVLPTRPRPTVFLDAGATADAKPEMLVQFAMLGTAYARVRLGVETPRVGLLTIGEEAGKGDKLTRRAYELLAGDVEGVDFAGNVEGSDLLTGKVDVVVTDGFTGNVALKTIEGAVRLAVAEMRQALTASRTAKLGALLQRRRLRHLRHRLDSETYGGGVLLGLNGTVVIAHGSSHAPGVAAACVLARDLAQSRIVEQIGERIAANRPHRLPRREESR